MVQFFILRSKVQQEYNGLLVNALNRIFNSNLSLNNFKWMLTKVELSCVRNIIPRSKKRLGNGYPVLNQELQNHNPFLRHIPVKVMYGSTPPPPLGLSVPVFVTEKNVASNYCENPTIRRIHSKPTEQYCPVQWHSLYIML